MKLDCDGHVPVVVLESLRARVRFPGYVIFDDDRTSRYLTRFYTTPDADWWRTRVPGVFLHQRQARP